MDEILKKQSECLKTGDSYRIKNQVHFINGQLDCNGPIFQRSCFVEFPKNAQYKSNEVCSLDCIEMDSHVIETKFRTNNCPQLRCRPLMFTGLFTGPDIGVKSFKYNVGKYINFSHEEGVNQEQKKVTDKYPQGNSSQNSSQMNSTSVQEQ